jgi:hypothetical protein
VRVIGRPARDETAPYYFRYIDRVPGDDVLGVLAAQLEETIALFEGISEERSLLRYAPEKWSVRQVVNHVSDVERLFQFRALWFARGFDSPLPAFDQDKSADAAGADEVSWKAHVEEFRAVRGASLGLFRNLPATAWGRSGVASGYPFSVKACAFIVAGHLAHHDAILRERYF